MKILWVLAWTCTHIDLEVFKKASCNFCSPLRLYYSLTHVPEPFCWKSGWVIVKVSLILWSAAIQYFLVHRGTKNRMLVLPPLIIPCLPHLHSITPWNHTVFKMISCRKGVTGGWQNGHAVTSPSLIPFIFSWPVIIPLLFTLCERQVPLLKLTKSLNLF